ncbi:hypothetical protein THICB1_120003 [Thiomonas arsenitoxydans]|uniref:Transposase n=1 Tax=Thiomonas arsenitoxydans (strain DSM 22701 / CIP 110005 / 3As) TaxID=426114 RepID=A0ABP1Z2Y5_THIA3|nr:hypothetical protein THICB1_120003 [Thiomonas arsenitoxydans]CQR35337.1 hypothetical protein THICB6_210041 [Thiomonas arsenitoxydans]CQR35581.1 hypothetical protein ACO7_450002 [Thiomonas arsenitoxydans]CQR35652.1 hypothetical protein ACO3_450002 [Thiomonas arsenitoxydans]
MATPPEIEAQILRYYHAERWRIGTIAAQLHVHRDTVARVLAQAGLPAVPGVLHRPSAIEPYLPFIGQTLKQFPSLTAARLYAMVRERGYGGRPDHFRHLIARHRPRRAAQAYLRLRTLQGSRPKSTGRTSGICRSAARAAPSWASSWCCRGRARSSCVSSSTRAWRASCSATSPPSKPGAAPPGSPCTTT